MGGGPELLGSTFTFNLDGRIDPGSVSGRVEVARRHHGGGGGFWFLQWTNEDVLPHLMDVRRR